MIPSATSLMSSSEPPSYDGTGLGDLVAAAHDSVKAPLQGGRGLREYLAGVDRMTRDDKFQVVEQAIWMLENFYAHLPFKRAMHAVDPVQRLRLLQRRLPQYDTEFGFHHELTDIFTTLRDLHTNYLLPSYFKDAVVFLPFRVKRCFVNDQPRFVLVQWLPGFSHTSFVPGVQLTYWNAIPIDRAVDLAAGAHAGSNEEARLERGVDGLTLRGLRLSPPPDEEWVTVGYLDASGIERELRTDWTVINLPPPQPGGPFAADSLDGAAPMAMGMDLEADLRRRVITMLYDPQVMAARQHIETEHQTILDESRLAGVDEEAAQTAAAVVSEQGLVGLASTLPEVVRAECRTIGGSDYGYLRILTFNVDDTKLVNEVNRLVTHTLFPQDGMILDVRGNGGGLIWAGERLLQLFTPKTIEPTRSQFLATSLTAQLSLRMAELQPWRTSLGRAVETGATFSAAFPITPPERCNDAGQCYYGPVVLITDARCYSTTDMFTAGFKDHGIGTILGVDRNTGAGGANVWTLDYLRGALQAITDSVPAPLPKEIGMRVAIRRTLRVGPEAGTEIEDLGIAPDVYYRASLDDVLHNDVGLMAAAAQVIDEFRKPPGVCRFAVDYRRDGGKAIIAVKAAGVGRVDAYVDDRPLTSVDVINGAADLALDCRLGAAVELKGYLAGLLVARRRLTA